MELILKEKEMLDLSERFSNYRVCCLEGCCWVTQEGDSRDLILRPGEAILVEGSSVIATAFCRTRLSVVEDHSIISKKMFLLKKSYSLSGSVFGF